MLTVLKQLIQRERALASEIIRALQIVESKKLYIEQGHATLFDFAVRELGYSDSDAYQRIQAMRLIKELPEIADSLAAGTVHLTSLVQIEKYGRALSKKHKLELLQKISGMTAKSAKHEIIHFLPESLLWSTIREIRQGDWEIRWIIPASLKQKIDQTRNELTHKYPQLTYPKLLEVLLDHASQKSRPSDKDASTYSSQNRYVPKPLRREIWKRDQSKCTFISPITGTRCESSYQLEIDHIQPFALGGRTEMSNLRLLCAEHNRWRAKQTFGRGA